LSEGGIPNVRGVRAQVGTSLNHVEGNRRASRTSHPKPLTTRNFFHRVCCPSLLQNVALAQKNVGGLGPAKLLVAMSGEPLLVREEAAVDPLGPRITRLVGQHKRALQ
jgi:hypothetical protein